MPVQQADRQALVDIAAQQLRIATGKLKGAPAAALRPVRTVSGSHKEEERRKAEAQARSQQVDWEAVGQVRRDLIRCVSAATSPSPTT